MQVYQLQTENDEEETWRDLVSLSYCLCRDAVANTCQSAHGFDRTLRLVATRREDVDIEPRSTTESYVYLLSHY